MAFKTRDGLDYLLFYYSLYIDLSTLIKRFFYIILVFCSILLAKEQTWTTTTFDYYWNLLLRRNTFREPIALTPFDIKVGQLTYGGSDYWDSGLLKTELGLVLPVVLDSMTTSFDIIDTESNRSVLFFGVDFFRINATNYIYNQNFLDLQFGLGYGRISALSNPQLPESGAWSNQLPSGNTRGGFRFRPLLNTFNINTSISFQPTNFLLGYVYHAFGYSSGTLYESTGGDYYLEGNGTSESFALGLQAVYHPKNRSFSFQYGIEGRWHRIKFPTIYDPSLISHITGLDMYAKGLIITFGTIFGGRRTVADRAFTHLINQKYEEASSGFEEFINYYPNHSRIDMAEKMLEFSYDQIPYQQFKKGLLSIKDMDIDSAVHWLSRASKIADQDLMFEIDSRRKDLAMVLIDSVAINKSSMTFKQAEGVIQKARKIAPHYPLVDDALAEIYIEKGDVLYKGKNYSRAYEYYKQAYDLSSQTQKIVRKKYNDITIGLMEEANYFSEQKEYVLAIQSLKTIIEIHPKRENDLGPILEELSLRLKEVELVETNRAVREIVQVKQKKRSDKSSYVLLLGMTPSQVQDITGEPDYIDRIEQRNTLFEMWTFNNLEKATRLYFEKNLLVKIEK